MDRLDYVSMVAGEHGFCMAVESSVIYIVYIYCTRLKPFHPLDTGPLQYSTTYVVLYWRGLSPGMYCHLYMDPGMGILISV